jgi:hypothetical protein
MASGDVPRSGLRLSVVVEPGNVLTSSLFSAPKASGAVGGSLPELAAKACNQLRKGGHLFLLLSVA